MTLSYGNLGISPLGTYGLGAIGSYGSYDAYMPSSYMSGTGAGVGMTDPSIFGMGGYGMGYGLGFGGYGMNAMMQYPLLYGQMQAQMEKNQLNHAMYMQNGVNQYGVSATESTDRSLFHTIGINGQIQLGVENLYRKVVSGDQKGIQDQFDELRNYILETYGDELKKLGSEARPIATVNQYIKQVYSQSVQAMTGQPASFEDDVRHYGRNALSAGFREGLKSGSSGIYTDQTIQHCLGVGIDEKGSKDRAQKVGKGLGYTVSTLEKGAYGAIIGTAGTATALGIVAGLAAPIKGASKSILKAIPKTLKWAAPIGAVVGLLYGIDEILSRKSGNATT